jgi:F-type H+-transporting ATPase subunit gamma
MASQRDIRRRIGAVKNIKQITRAMQFVAASKLKRAQDATLAARPYSEKLDEVLADLASVLGGEDHPLLATPEGGKRLVVLITTDRPLSGPLNTNIVRFVSRDIIDKSGDLALITVGRKGRDAMRRSGVPIEAHFPTFGDRPTFADVGRRSASSPTRPHVYADAGVRLLRVDAIQRPRTTYPDRTVDHRSPATSSSSNRTSAVLERPFALRRERLYFRPSSPGEGERESSRMVAMKNATENAEDLIEDLTISYNKVRQSNITREMIEIASGADAR